MIKHKIKEMSLGTFKKRHPSAQIICKTENLKEIGYCLYNWSHQHPFIWTTKKNFRRAEKEIKRDIEMRKREFNTLMKKADPMTWESLVSLVREVGDNCRAYKRFIADYNSKWGDVSYFEKYKIDCGSKYEMSAKTSKAYKIMSKAVKETKSAMGNKDHHLGLDGIVKVDDGDYYIAFISGGNNGNSDWISYLESLSHILKSQKRAWLIDMSRHSDIYYVTMGFEI